MQAGGMMATAGEPFHLITYANAVIALQPLPLQCGTSAVCSPDNLPSCLVAGMQPLYHPNDLW